MRYENTSGHCRSGQRVGLFCQDPAGNLYGHSVNPEALSFKRYLSFAALARVSK